jgi:hypothetical protein
VPGTPLTGIDQHQLAVRIDLSAGNPTLFRIQVDVTAIMANPSDSRTMGCPTMSISIFNPTMRFDGYSCWKSFYQNRRVGLDNMKQLNTTAASSKEYRSTVAAQRVTSVTLHGLITSGYPSEAADEADLAWVAS